MPTRRVLTVNQVYHILLLWLETRDWESAFYQVIVRLSALSSCD
jgi:tRNA (guanine9-N1)-methyltransferase